MKPTTRRDSGFTLVEVIAALVIVSTVMVYALAAIGNATDKVLDTVNRRKMSYLMQIVMADVEIGRLSPDEETERFEEGYVGTFEGFGSIDDPDEYANYEYVVEVLRDEVVVGGNEDEFKEAGFTEGADGTLIGEPVSNDVGYGELFGEGGVPEDGQLKRVVVIMIRRMDDDDSKAMRVMTYLPYPGEEERQITPGGVLGGLGGPGAAGAGGAGGAGDGAEAIGVGSRGADGGR